MESNGKIIVVRGQLYLLVLIISAYVIYFKKSTIRSGQTAEWAVLVTLRGDQEVCVWGGWGGGRGLGGGGW